MILQRHFKNWLVAVCCLLFSTALMAQPANDSCEDAEVITVGTVTGTTIDADNTLTTTCGTSNTAADVFYSFTAATDGQGVFSLCGSDYDTKISVFTGTCGALTCVGGDDDASCGLQSVFTTEVTAGTTYTIVIHGFNDAEGDFTLDVSVAEEPPANDDCTAAEALTLGTTTSGTTTVATESEAFTGCTGTEDDDVWYTFVAPASGEVVIILDEIEGTTADLVHAVLSGNCDDGFTAENCSDPNASIVRELTAGETYYIQVYSWSSALQAVDFDITVTELPPAPANDDCAAAEALTLETATSGRTTSATASDLFTGCTGTEDDDVWYTFVAPASGNVQIILDELAGTTADLVHAVLSGNCDDELTAENCSDPNSSIVNGLTAGETYYIQVYTWSSAEHVVNFNITVRELPPAPANDDCAAAEALTLEAATSGTVTSATASALFTACAGTEDDDVWYTFVAPATGDVEINLTEIEGTTAALAHAVLGGNCDDGFTEENCATITSRTDGLTPGETYYIQVFSGSSVKQIVDFMITVSEIECDIDIIHPTATFPPTVLVAGEDFENGDTYADAGRYCFNYPNGDAADFNPVLELCAAGSGQTVTVTFEEFELEDGFDFLRVAGDANGNDGEFTATNNPGSFTSEDGGCLQFEFEADATVTEPGWLATITLEGEPVILPDPVYQVDLAAITNINRTLNEDCQAILTPRQVLTGNWDVDGDGNEPDASLFKVVVQDDDSCNGPIIDGCGRYIYTVEPIPMNPEPIRGFTGCFGPENWFLASEETPNGVATSAFVGDDLVITATDSDNSGNQNVGAAFYTFAEGGTVMMDVSVFATDVFFFFGLFPVTEDPALAFTDFEGNIVQIELNTFDSIPNVIDGTIEPTLFEGTISFVVEPGFTLNLGVVTDGFLSLFPDAGPTTFTISNFAFQPTGREFPVEGFTTGWGYVNAEDKTPPAFTVEPTAPDELFCTDLELININELASDISRCWRAEAGTGNLIPGTLNANLRNRLTRGGGIPRVIDGCSDVEICVNDIVTRGSDACEDVVITRVFTARDGFTCGAVSGEENEPAEFSYDIIFTSPSLDDVVGITMEAEFITCVDAADGGINPQPTATDYPFIRRGNTNIHLGQSFCNLGAAFEDSPRIIICENAYKFVRTYTVIDWCEPSRVETFSQTVKVGDFEDPVIEVIEMDADFDGQGDGLPLVYSTNSNDCSAFIDFFAQVDVQDNCDENPDLSAYVFPEGNLNGAPLGPFFPGALAGGFPVGDHIVRVLAVDNCDNRDTLEIPFIVRDMAAPVAICENGLNISLESNGKAKLCAEDIDRASYDDCSDITLHIARVNNNNAPIGGPSTWTDCLTIECSELGTLRVGLRVTDTSGISNFCWLDVLIEDKIAPICIPPDDVRLNCDELVGTFPADVEDAFTADPLGTAALLNELFGAPNILDNCDEGTVTQSVRDRRNSCGLGFIDRTFRVRDAQGLSAPNCSQTITILGLHDYSILLPADTEEVCMDASYNAISVDERGCDLINIATTIDTFQASADECYKLRITYEILNWCEWNGEDDAYVIPRSALDIERDNWLHVVPENRATIADDLAFLDRDNNPNNGQGLIDELDTSDGGLVEGSDPSAGYGDDGSRGAFIYRQFVKVYDDEAPVITVNTPDGPFCDLDGDCAANADLSFTIDDACNGASVGARAFLDAFRDPGADDIYTLADFPADAPDISSSIERLPDGTFTLNLENLPVGQHAVRISATDGCGNNAVELLLFEIADCKAPTPICINGLTVTLMPDGNDGGMAEIWASDFIASPSTDCSGEVTFSIYHPSEYSVPGFSPAPGRSGITLDCDDFAATPLIVRIYAFDPAGRNDYCETTLKVQAFQPGLCTSGGGSLAGAISTPNAQGVDNVEVNIAGGGVDNDMAMTQNGGYYTFDNLQEGADYTVQPAYDPAVNLGNVSTADLIMISRHILGSAQLTGQYQLRAADVTQDASINVLDIIAIRRVILGIDASFSQTPSWKFYTNGGAEVYNVNNLEGTIANANFVAVEMGNVSDAIAGAQTATGRGLESIQVEDIEVVAGNTYAVAFDAANLAGFQATIELVAGLELVSVDYASEQATGFNLAQAAEGLIAVSHIGEGAFTLELRATTNGQLSELLKLSNRIATSEAYPANGGVANLNLDFISSNEEALFALEQNTPNPFADVTKIDFKLPVAADVNLTVQDIQGRLLLSRELKGQAGYNTTNINIDELGGATGVMTYTIVAGDFTATRKMVVVR